ncbi:hypothetical protein HFN20_13955 [Paenibacillus dendritiformis]|uniref:hypothetical protein n=1 Tax=Paenibacillus dendritiformis TaxID=130049 RepID=UPI00143CC9ED|nr:hypothetical protein [Paenibacillus dendritiformis]NKI22308.1 hypothetical protein [Paenibacillus dendritiformis]NRF99526.1 hypothetical protein [Paenibacillus dendritiformis]
MAKVGDVLKQPEAGWKRYDDGDPSVKYFGTFIRESNVNFYNGASNYATSVDFKIKFDFIGTKIRIIGVQYPNKFPNVPITIDGVTETFSQVGSLNYQVLQYEKTGLEYRRHTVEIAIPSDAGNNIGYDPNNANVRNIQMDAIDIDENGQLKPYNPIAQKFLIQSDRGYHSIFNGRFSSGTAVPKMTSNTTPSGRAFAKDVWSSTYDVWKAFNQVDDYEEYCSQNGSGGVGFLGYEFPRPISIFKYTLRSMGNSSALTTMPKDWTFEGSNDGVKWHVLDKQENQTWNLTNSDKDYFLRKPELYKMYRLNWTANNGHTGYTGINELKMYETPEPNILIHVPSMDKQNFINHGMGKASVIDFEAEFTQKSFIKTESSVLGDGRLFKQQIDTSKIPIKKVSIE